MRATASGDGEYDEASGDGTVGDENSPSSFPMHCGLENTRQRIGSLQGRQREKELGPIKEHRTKKSMVAYDALHLHNWNVLAIERHSDIQLFTGGGCRV